MLDVNVNWSRTPYRPVADVATAAGCCGIARRCASASRAVGHQCGQLLSVQSSCREHKRGREGEPDGEAEPCRQSATEETAAARPVKPTAVHWSDRTRATDARRCARATRSR
jgi:hypothetical protein